MFTIVILTRNEQRNIVDCIQAVRPFAGEVLLIDMESQDETVALATPLVDKVLHHPLMKNFDSARNIAISEAEFDWLWFVDADERISDLVGRTVTQLVRERGHEFEAINIPFKTFFCGKWIAHSGWWPGYTMPRVLKKGHFKFSEQLHGGVELDGREVRLPPDPALGVNHFSYLSIEHYIEKFNRYTSTEAAQLHAGNQSIDWRNGIAHMMRDLWMYYEANRGSLDGRHGWLLAWLSGQYRWLSHAKLLDLDPNCAEPDSQQFPPDLDSVLRLMSQELERMRVRRPLLPFGVVWRSPIWDPSGYADEGRCISKALARTERHVALEGIHWNFTRCEVSEADRALFSALQRVGRAKSNISITNCIPTLVAPDPLATVNIIRTTFETDRIPQQWLPHLEQFDEVWVISQHNRRAFVRSGVAPERLRVMPSFLDTEAFRPEGPKYPLPESLNTRFMFLSIFDWQLRKGWDLLVAAYCQCFGPNGGVGLLLKITRAHGHPLEIIQSQIAAVLQANGYDLSSRPDIVLMDQPLSAMEMASLYRAADVFVLPTRGEGWGRPYMEAMACGLPTIGTGASGNVDFMTSENSFLLPAELVDVPPEAAREISVYEGHQWYEPKIESLKEAMTRAFLDANAAKQLGQVARASIEARFSIEAGRSSIASAIEEVESRFIRPRIADPDPSSIRVVWEGEFFAGHSFSNINEIVCRMLFNHKGIELACDRKVYNPTDERACRNPAQFQTHFERQLENPHVVIRHSFPPNWEQPQAGRWIHIQPWEFGHLPQAWMEPLQRVDEIWAPSEYVRRIYERSGIHPGKIHVIPWGIDPAVFTPDAPARILQTSKTFRFLFVGGTIQRKGYDRVLEAYTKEFGPDDDVCLVVKDMGTQTFYRYGNLRDPTLTARDDQRLPEIVYFDGSWTPGQLASLYTACQCLVMPYRGEGFGLPILEAMACGLPPIVPRGGASDDFVTEETGFFLHAREVETQHEWPLVGPTLELDVSIEELRQQMRSAYQNAAETAERGRRASLHVHVAFTWAKSLEKMVDRLQAVSGRSVITDLTKHSAGEIGTTSRQTLSACVFASNNERSIADCLSSLLGHVDEIIVLDRDSTDRTAAIAREYGASVVSAGSVENGEIGLIKQSIKTTWYFRFEAADHMRESEAVQIRPFIGTQPENSREIVLDCDSMKGSEEAEGRSLRFFRHR